MPLEMNDVQQKQAINSLCTRVHEANKKWWQCLDCGGTQKLQTKKEKETNGIRYKIIKCPYCINGNIKRNVGELLCLVHSEISEALEGHRKNLMDDKLHHRSMFEVELADAVIRIFDIAGGLGLDLGSAFVEKMAFNCLKRRS